MAARELKQWKPCGALPLTTDEGTIAICRRVCDAASQRVCALKDKKRE